MTDFPVRVIIDPSNAVRNSREVRGALNDTENAADSLRRTLQRAFTITAIGIAAKQVLELADTFTRVQNRLRTVTNGTAQLNSVTQQLFEISNRTRSSFEATAELYARVGLAARDLGISQQQLLQFTESLNQALILSGASAEEARAGLIQLSQGLASGALRGDELRSVLEQLPVVADIIAQELQVTRGELRELGAQGQITADIVLRAFANAREELEDRFAETVPTVGQALTVLNNSVLELVGNANEAVGATALLAQGLVFLGDNLGTLVNIAGAAVVVLGARFLGSVVATIPSLSALTAATVANTQAFIANAAATNIASASLTRFSATARGALGAVGGPVGAAVIGFVALQVAVNEINQDLDALGTTAEELGRSVDTTGIIIDGIRDDLSEFSGVAMDASSSTDEFTSSVERLAEARRQDAIAALEQQRAELLRQRAQAEAQINELTTGFNAIGVDIAATFTGSPSTSDFEELVPLIQQRITPAVQELDAEIERIQNLTLEDLTSEAERVGESLSGGAEAAEEAAKAIENLENAVLVASQTTERGREDFEALLSAGLDPLQDAATETGQRVLELVDELRRIEEANEAAEEAARTQENLADTVRDLSNEIAVLNAGVGNEAEVLQILQREGIDPTNQAYSEQITLISELVAERNQLTEATRLANEEAEEAARIAQDQAEAIANASSLVTQTIASLDQEAAALRLTGAEREANLRVLELEQQLREDLIRAGVNPDAVQITEQEREQIRLSVQRNQALQEQASILDSLRGPQQQLNEQLIATNALYEQGDITASEYNRTIAEIAESQRDLRISLGEGDFFDGFLSQLPTVAEATRSVASEIGTVFGSTFDQLATGFADVAATAIFDAENIGEAFKDLARSLITDLVSALIQVGVQFLINQAIGNAANAAAVGAATATGSSIAASFAPAAAAVSLATSGANAIPAAAGISSVNALSLALASVPGARDGEDFVQGAGSSISDSVLRRVAVGEGIVNAQANANNPGVVSAMNNGEIIAGSGQGQVVNVSMTVVTQDADSFGKNRKQIVRDLQRELEGVS